MCVSIACEAHALLVVLYRCEVNRHEYNPKCHGILQVVDEFRQAARNAIDAGFNGVEIHGANVSFDLL